MHRIIRNPKYSCALHYWSDIIAVIYNSIHKEGRDDIDIIMTALSSLQALKTQQTSKLALYWTCRIHLAQMYDFKSRSTYGGRTNWQLMPQRGRHTTSLQDAINNTKIFEFIYIILPQLHNKWYLSKTANPPWRNSQNYKIVSNKGRKDPKSIGYTPSSPINPVCKAH